MLLVLKNDNVCRLVLNWSYPFAPETYHHSEFTFGYIETYELVWVNPTKKYRIGNKFKAIAFYRIKSVESALKGGSFEDKI